MTCAASMSQGSAYGQFCLVALMMWKNQCSHKSLQVVNVQWSIVQRLLTVHWGNTYILTTWRPIIDYQPFNKQFYIQLGLKLLPVLSSTCLASQLIHIIQPLSCVLPKQSIFLFTARHLNGLIQCHLKWAAPPPPPPQEKGSLVLHEWPTASRKKLYRPVFLSNSNSLGTEYTVVWNWFFKQS